MALSIAQQAYSGSIFPSGTIAFPNPMGAGNLVLVMAYDGSSDTLPSSLGDSAGNTYSLSVEADDTADGAVSFIYSCLSGATYAGTNTVTFGASHMPGPCFILEVTGASSWTSGPTANKTNPYSGNNSTLSIGPVNVASQPAFLLSGVWVTGNVTTVSAGGSFAYLANSPSSLSGYASLSGTYDIVTSNGNVTSAQTVSASTGWSGVLASFYGAPLTKSDTVPMTGGGRGTRNASYIKMAPKDLRDGARAQEYLRAQRDRYRAREAA
jgi:hypothetical protein